MTITAFYRSHIVWCWDGPVNKMPDLSQGGWWYFIVVTR